MMRAQSNVAVAILLFFGTLAAAALLYTVMNQAADPIFNMATNASNTSKTGQGVGDAKQAWNLGLALVLPLTMILGIGAAAAAGGKE